MSNGNLAEKGLTFDDVLEAVQESSRGRWFLDEFQNRAKRDDSGKILAAIAKIEARIESFSVTNAAVDELEKVRNAIAGTRREIVLQEPVSSELSDEGRMFAKLAELARKTVPGQAASEKITNSVIKTLNLVDELDQTLNGQILNSQARGPKPADTYFNADNDIFAPTPKIQKPVLVQPAPAEPVVTPVIPTLTPVVDDTVGKGAKLVIHRTKSEATAAANEQAPIQQPPTSFKQPDPAVQEHISLASPRIVIIRRKPEDMAEVPLSDGIVVETAA